MFKKAQRFQSKLKIAVTGPSGSGKTFSALRLATGVGGKIAVIDTENGTASLYADRFEFDTVDLKPPYTVDKYAEAIQTAVKSGYNVLIIDSISHQWRGEGGILDRKEKLDARGGNSFTNWAKLTPEQERFLSAILHSDIHLISTIRSKQEYALVAADGNKTKVQKLGLAPVQRDGVEYEFTTVFDVAMNHDAEASKDRTGLFADKVFRITEETGEEFIKWMHSGSVRPPEPPPPKTSHSPAPGAKPTSLTVGRPPEPPADPGAYVPQSGQFKGKRLDEIKPGDLEAYLLRLEEDFKSRKQAITGKTLEFTTAAWAYVESFIPKIDTEEQLPDFRDQSEPAKAEPEASEKESAKRKGGKKRTTQPAEGKPAANQMSFDKDYEPEQAPTNPPLPPEAGYEDVRDE